MKRTMEHTEGCLICGAPLEYLAEDVPMICAVCGKREPSKTRCVNGHYVCSECHTRGMDALAAVCLNETGKDPVAIVEKLMDMPFCHMHGPEHHVMVGAALLTAYKNAGGTIDLPRALREALQRGKGVPGGACGFWGACGAAVSAGIFVSIVTMASPLAKEPWGLANLATAAALSRIGALGGPRCCKRNSYTAILAAVEFAREHLGVSMETGRVVCTRSARNSECLNERCPYNPGTQKPQQ